MLMCLQDHNIRPLVREASQSAVMTEEHPSTSCTNIFMGYTSGKGQAKEAPNERERGVSGSVSTTSLPEQEAAVHQFTRGESTEQQDQLVFS